ncbi:MAG: type I-C CRISPR-associated protein Cas8c/Csd1 [Desulfobacteraceae bacterium]|jgi:CRISPR-associated protein Csd1
MILQALNTYYERLRLEGCADLAKPGFQQQKIPFIVVLDTNGVFTGFVDTRVGEGKKKTARTFTVPKGVKKSSGIAANLLWDTPVYVFGRPGPDPKKDPEKLAQRAQEQHLCFIKVIRDRLADILEDPGILAVLRFLKTVDSSPVFNHSLWPEVQAGGAIISFQLQGDTCLICERPAVVAALKKQTKPVDAKQQICLISGQTDEIARLHTAIKGVYGAQTAGANIVSFNLPAFTSYNKKQSFNAPVGNQAEFAYTTALNRLLAKGSIQRMQVGDASTVFWTEKKHQIETVFAGLFGEPPKGESDQDYKEMVAAFRAPETGALPHSDPDTRFFVLGLSPNAARIAIRFWYVGTVAETAHHILRHFTDIEITHAPNAPRYLSLFRLLVSTAALNKSENIPPNLAGDFMRAILSGAPYPKTLFSAAIRRCRAEQKVTYPRAALIKAVLTRNARYYKKSLKEVAMALDHNITNPGYRLGRLFAALEKIQEEANPGINATIRDRFYASASATPVSAFPHLMKLKNHHIAKLENRGRAVNLEKLIGEIIDAVNDFPTHLSLPDQGRFAVGYYHQRQAFFTKQESN